MTSDHFQGKSIPEHLKEARRRGAMATGEIHGAELPGQLSAAYDSSKDTATAFFILWAIGMALSINSLTLIFFTFACGWTLWKTGRSALLGYAKLERLHRVIEEERFEIEHHREQEKQELHEMYQVKGFSGKLLDEVVDVLMADDNRLLRVMLEEELGLSLEVYEHPLKQAFGAFLGAAIASALIIFAYYFSSNYGVPFLSLSLVMLSATLCAKKEKRHLISSAIWNFSLSLFAGAVAYFLARLIL